MHNHKEVLCKSPDCDRSRPGKGFPRKWNAYDHMKRVHRYTVPEDSTSNSGEASSPSASSQIDVSFSEASTLTGNPTTKRRNQNLTANSGNSTRKAKPSGKSARGVGRAAQSPSEDSKPQRFIEQDMLSHRHCAQASYGHNNTDWIPWHQQFHPTA